MSTVIRFFVAPSHEAAAAVVDCGPDRAFESLSYGNFDAGEALTEWESIFTGRSFEGLVAADEPEAVTGSDDGDGPVVFAASEALRDALAAADQAQLGEVSQLWVQKRAADGETFDQEIATEILSELARLARGVGRRHHFRGLIIPLAAGS
ncbi:hypothetical protein [Saccharomonospora azurea]|uniref:hypothetical protein n=1 Tax=Saccharomonospora azurea TaxID=40988 RepID=UPI003D8F527F